MPDFAQPVTFTFIASTVAAILAVTGIGILLVKLGKKSRNPK